MKTYNLNLPIISIITVSFNAEKTIESTILSVINQTYPNIEYIIIDGGSTDNTIEIIKKYEHRISYWTSEPDKGIYDAMNKGVKIATGKWINFMNSGDTFYNNNIISRIFNKIDDYNQYSAIYGDTEFIFSNKNKIVTRKATKLYKIMPSCHQSIFCLSEKLKMHNFNLKYKFAADLDFFNWLFRSGDKYQYVNLIISSYDAVSGISSSNAYECQKEVLSILYPSAFQYYIHLYLYIAKQVIKKIIIRK